MSARAGSGARHAQRGVALIMALWLTVLLTVIGGAFAYSMRSEGLASRNAVALAQARAAADGAIERTVFELLRPRMPDSWKPDGRSQRWQDGELAIVVSARDETARIDLNLGAEPLLRSLFVNLGGMSDADATALVDAVADWRDADDLRRPNGAEAPDYRAANSNYLPANQPFESIGELSRVRGMTPAIYARVAGALSIHARRPGINALTASRDVLRALPGATVEAVDEYLARREEALAANLSLPTFPPALPFMSGGGPVWRIQAEASLADGTRFVREAVVRATADPRRPFLALLWTEGDHPPPPVTLDGATAAPSVPTTTPPDARRS